MVATRVDRVRAWSSTTNWGSARWERLLAALAAVVAFWPQYSPDAESGIDPSWEAAVALARIHHLAWGREIVFTYGPFAFLQNTGSYSAEQAMLATIYQVIIVATLFLGVAAILRRRYPPLAALVGAFVTTGIAAVLLGYLYPELVILAAFTWASLLLLPEAPRRSTAFTTCVLIGAAGGFEVLVKFNTGPVVVVIALAASILLDWRAIWRHLATAAAFAVPIPVWWLLAGQQLGNLPAWLRYSSQIVSGYIEGQAIPIPAHAVGAVLITLSWLVVVCVMFVRGGPRIPRNYVLLVALVTALIAKASFGRYDDNHFSVLLGLMVITVAITPLYGIVRRGFEITIALALVVYMTGILVIEQRPLAVAQAPERAVDRLAGLAWPGLADRHVRAGQARQRAQYGIPESFIKAIGSGTVHIDPDETSAAWAYGFAWRPAPVFQTYSSYTPDLDRLNAETLTANTQFVLSRRSATIPATGINDRLGVEESPLYSRALLCDYTVTGNENNWALFSHTGSRCGPLTALPAVTVRDGDVVTVPAPSTPNDAILVGIDLAPTLVDRLFMGTVVPLTAFTIVLDGKNYRLIPGNAAEPFLLTTPAAVAGTDLEIRSGTIGVGRTRSLGQAGPAARLRFYEMSVNP